MRKIEDIRAELYRLIKESILASKSLRADASSREAKAEKRIEAILDKYPELLGVAERFQESLIKKLSLM